MAGCAVFCSRLMKRTVSPKLSNLGMTIEAESRLAFALETAIGGAMTAVAGNALPFFHRLVAKLLFFNPRLHICMAIETDLPGLAFNQIGLTGTMSAMT